MPTSPIQISLTESMTAINTITRPTLDITIFPIPNKGDFSVKNNSEAGMATIQIWNLQGQLIYEEMAYLDAYDTKEIHLDNHHKGLFTMGVKIGNRSKMVPIVIE